MPEAADPPVQSSHAMALGLMTVFMTKLLGRQPPGFVRFHHAGTVPPAALRFRSTRTPSTPARSTGMTKDTTMSSTPELVLQANTLFGVPPSPKHLSQR